MKTLMLVSVGEGCWHRHLIVKRYIKGRCYACIWAHDTPEDRIRNDMRDGTAEFHPFNETTGMFVLGHFLGKGRRIRR